MKFFFITLLFSFCICEGKEKIIKSTSLTKQRPPYYISPMTNKYYSSNDSLSDKLNTIFNQLKKSTCLKFKKESSRITNEIGINFDISVNGTSRVELSNSITCPTNISLSINDYNNYTLLRFYLGIALDIIPEVRRPDREIDVKVNMSNVMSDFEQYYNIINSSDITYLNDTEFDFKSPMFFGPYFGSKNGKPTYEVELYKNYQYFSTSGKVFRHNDYKHIFYYYCFNNESKHNDCNYGGYYAKKTDENCTCPEYFSGPKCGNFSKKGIYVNYTTISPPQANTTKQYLVGNITKLLQYVNLTSENKGNISVTIEKLEFEKTNCSKVISFLEVLVRNDKGAAGINFCKNDTNITLPALSNQVVFVFQNQDENQTVFYNISYFEKTEKNANTNRNKQNTDECIITVQPKCTCPDKKNDYVHIRLLEYGKNGGHDIKMSNSHVNGWDCNRNYTFTLKNVNNKDLKDLCVRITHMGCADNNIYEKFFKEICKEQEHGRKNCKYICTEK